MKHRFLPFFLLLLFSAVAFAQEPMQVEVTPLTKRIYLHISYNLYQGQPFPSNGLVVEGDTSVLIIDSAWDSLQTEQLLHWVSTELKKPVSYCIVTHGHADRTGGQGALRRNSVPVVYAAETGTASAAEGRPLQGIRFNSDTTIAVAGARAEIYYPGKGHTADNRVVWLPAQQLLFGGCLVKSKEASTLGNTASADLQAWPETIRQLYRKYPTARIVVPGHQQWGNVLLLMHTQELLKRNR